MRFVLFFLIFSIIFPLLGNSTISEKISTGSSLSGNTAPENTGVVMSGSTSIFQWKTTKKKKLQFQFWSANASLATTKDDSSITRFVSKYIPLAQKEYEPSDLIRITHPSIDEAGRSSKLRSEATRSLWKMAIEFEREFQAPFVVISGYRSAAYQQRMWDLGRCNSTLCAPPGYSEHQLGLAIDVFDASTESEYYKNPKYRAYVQWLQKNAHLYGWTQSYQKWVDIDYYDVEPWHWRYVGIDMASKLKNLGWTYTEYIRFNEAISWIR